MKVLRDILYCETAQNQLRGCLNIKFHERLQRSIKIIPVILQYPDNNLRQAGADITGQLQVRPMLYTLYIDINAIHLVY